MICPFGFRRPDLLGGPCDRHLDAVLADAEVIHHGFERLAVRFDVLGQLRKEVAQLGSLVARRGALCELDADHGAGEMVVQVDAEILRVDSANLPGLGVVTQTKPRG